MEIYVGFKEVMSISSSKSWSSDRKSTRFILGAIAIAAILVVELIGSALLQQRAQTQLLHQFKNQLRISASAYGQPGLSPLPDTAPAFNSPIGLLNISAIELNQVVAEGSNSGTSQLGPAHVNGSALPGQGGESIIIGRRTTYGAPFFDLDSLTPGLDIKVTTLQGTSTYKVIDPSKTEVLPANRLILRTSNPPILSLRQVAVVAELQGKPFAPTPKNSPVQPAKSELPLLIVFIQMLVGAAFAYRLLITRFGRDVTWLILVPVVVAAVVGITLTIDSFLPATL